MAKKKMKKRKMMGVKSSSAPEPEVHQFEIVAGIHRDRTTGTMIEYEAGEVIESDKPLDQMYANKFKRLTGKTKRPKDLDETLDQSGHVMDAPKTLAQKRKEKAKTKRIQTNPSDSRFADDDEEEEVEEEETEDEEEGEVEEEDEEEEVSTADVSKPKPHGKEVTDKFPDLAKADLLVFKDKKKGFTVVDKDSPETILAPHLKTEKAVANFFKKYKKK